ncbi:velvet factor, partial [Panaeolus papilionaceus]
LVGQPIRFTTGQFAGCTIRMVLQEIQKADLGRKYARVDRRPLDPPPVVLLRLYMIHNYGTSEEYEVELNYDDVQDLGLLCTVDLFPVPPPDAAYQGSSSSPDAPVPSYYPSDGRAPRRRTPISAPPVLSSFPVADPPLRGQRDGYHLPQGGLVTQFQSSGPSEPDVVYYHNGFPIVEGSKETASLVGQTFIQPITIDYMGNKAIVFAFTDLAVKIEGTFILRYRVFDIFSRPSSHNDGCVSAETYGGMFRVYSTKDFPGLSKSTELTKHLARYGLRVNIRETERKRRRK